MLSVGEFIAQFESALRDKNWSALTQLDEQMRSVVTHEQAQLHATNNKSQAGITQRAKQLEKQLTLLRQLYQQAQELAVALKEQTGKEVQQLSAGKAGISAYKRNEALK